MNDRLNSILVVIVPFFPPPFLLSINCEGRENHYGVSCSFPYFSYSFSIFCLFSFRFEINCFFFVVSERNLSWYSCLTRFSFSFRRINYSGGGQVEGSE